MSPQCIFKMAEKLNEEEELPASRFTTQFIEKMAEMEALADDILNDRQQVLIILEKSILNF